MGSVEVSLTSAQGLRDVETFGKQDPYVLLTCGKTRLRTRTHRDGGKNPIWNETFTVPVNNETDLVLKLYDENAITADTLIGTATVPLAKVLTQGSEIVAAPVISSGRAKGVVNVVLRCLTKPPGFAHSATAPAGGQQPSSAPPAAGPAPPGYPPSSQPAGYPPSSQASLYPPASMPAPNPSDTYARPGAGLPAAPSASHYGFHNPPAAPASTAYLSQPAGGYPQQPAAGAGYPPRAPSTPYGAPPPVVPGAAPGAAPGFRNLTPDDVETLTLFFRAMDADNNGFVTVAEICKACAVDLDQDGFISPIEAARCSNPWIQMLAQQDRNGDSRISLQELLEYNDDTKGQVPASRPSAGPAPAPAYGAPNPPPTSAPAAQYPSAPAVYTPYQPPTSMPTSQPSQGFYSAPSGHQQPVLPHTSSYQPSSDPAPSYAPQQPTPYGQPGGYQPGIPQSASGRYPPYSQPQQPQPQGAYPPYGAQQGGPPPSQPPQQGYPPYNPPTSQPGYPPYGAPPAQQGYLPYSGSAYQQPPPGPPGQYNPYSQPGQQQYPGAPSGYPTR